ncbi:MAG TPA: WYL domain-containing protein [Nocardioidaceae bacterium]|nr:WYL domain-containing protein [Nocardioidaceae bacterium]
MLKLVPYLQVRDGISVEEVARDFGVTPAEIVKDLRVLWFCGLPNSVSGDLIEVDMEAVKDDGAIHLSNAEFLTRPLRLTPSEGLALVVALRALAEAAGPTERDAVRRALAKLESALGDVAAPAAAVDVQLQPVQSDTRERVDRALHEGRQLHLSYYVPARDETTERDVDPMRIIVSEGHSYLEGWCHLAEETRLFRLDRMVSAEVLEAAAEPPEGARQLDLARGLFQPSPGDPVAVVDLSPAAHWVAEYYPVEEARPGPGGGLRIRLRFADPRWLERLLLRLGGSATLVEPADLAAAVRARAAAALSAYPDV